MPFTEDYYLPSQEELTVQEINLSAPLLKAGAVHFGKYCDEQCKVSKYILVTKYKVSYVVNHLIKKSRSTHFTTLSLKIEIGVRESHSCISQTYVCCHW